MRCRNLFGNSMKTGFITRKMEKERQYRWEFGWETVLSWRSTACMKKGRNPLSALFTRRRIRKTSRHLCLIYMKSKCRQNRCRWGRWRHPRPAAVFVYWKEERKRALDAAGKRQEGGTSHPVFAGNGSKLSGSEETFGYFCLAMVFVLWKIEQFD